MKRFIVTISVLFFILGSSAQESMDYFLPNNISYHKNIPTPEQHFKQMLGEWHLTYDQVLSYLKELSQTSDRAIMYEYARSWENKPLVHLVFTSAENHKNLDQLKSLHYDYSEPGKNISSEKVPLVISLTYGVHGNESSATNSAALTAYYLAAAQGEKIDELLENNIIIIDPCLNPDGFTRHNTWANMHQSSVANGDNNSRQFDEVWPGGRTNHYWFDLNRDYLLLVHPESKGRVAKFHEWKPNIVTDHHEMGANSTFFFQPGVPSRNNPLTPEKNYELTHEIAKYHATFLDKIGSSYFSEEQFDDYYFGKGSSYPDINASVGILFEQAGYRGRKRETINGTKTLAFGIKNQFTVSLSTLEAAMNLRSELLEMQKEFYSSALDLGKQNTTKAYIFGNENDKVKTQYFVDFLNQHQIEVFENTQNFTSNDKTFKAGSSFVVPTQQKQFRLIHSIFEEVKSFADTTFYDVSTWTFTHALNVENEKLSSLKSLSLSEKAVQPNKVKGQIIGGESQLAYLFRWNEFSTAETLYKLQNSGLRTKVATNNLSITIDEKEERFANGTILLPVNAQGKTPQQIHRIIKTIAANTGVDFYAVKSGLTAEGIDLGSNSFEKLEKPKVLLFVGEGASSRDAGEIWHLFDQRYQMPITLCETNRLNRISLERYNTIILTGTMEIWNPGEVQKLKNWISAGGTLIAYKSASNWVAKQNLSATKFKDQVKPDSTKYVNYIDRRKERTLNSISGAIFEAEMDLTHPLCYGYTNKNIAIFKTSSSVAKSLDKKYTEPVKFTNKPYVSGWVSEANIKRIEKAPIVSVQKVGSGKVISYHDNMTFRGIWLGTNKLFSNAVFFGNIIQ